MERSDGRGPRDLRPIKAERGYLDYAEGSVLWSCGNTRVLVAASVEERVPEFLRGSGRGWVTAEYSMLPRATNTRSQREVSKGRLGGRTHEIQRLIGRSLRGVMKMSAIGERTVWLDCDVLQADGGTRTAAISAAYVALVDACRWMQDQGLVAESPVVEEVAAVSVGIVSGVPCVDLAYVEDATAEVDMNLVMTGSGKYIEVQGTAEGQPFDETALSEMLTLGRGGIEEIFEIQRATLSS